MKSFKLKSLTICIFLLYAYTISAQNTVKGTVRSENKQETVYASVRLLHSDSTFVQGTLTDSIGNYRFLDVVAGGYLLSVSSMGYVPQWHAFTVGNQDKELPLISLKESSVMLGEVVVKGAGGDPGMAADIPDGNLVKVPLTHQGERCVQDGQFRLFGLCFALICLVHGDSPP